ncbi:MULTISPECIES: hypothetical protein [unclassified Streptomyces]|uniref:hypothetical protein n=1 Tax=unclassified Streptomyces TaxID=2593676 RepID=UPI002E286449|nr:hypothetical protein [Streptomyces sp. NBC_00223]
MTKPAAARRILPSSPFKQPAPAPLKVFETGDRVSHDGHGLGRVIGVEHDAVVVDFGSLPRRIPSPYTRMTKL